MSLAGSGDEARGQTRQRQSGRAAASCREDRGRPAATKERHNRLQNRLYGTRTGCVISFPPPLSNAVTVYPCGTAKLPAHAIAAFLRGFRSAGSETNRTLQPKGLDTPYTDRYTDRYTDSYTDSYTAEQSLGGKKRGTLDTVSSSRL